MNLEDINKIAKLARIELTEAESDKLNKQFVDILANIKQIDALDLSDASPVSHPFNIKNVFREDIPSKFAGSEELIKIAPSSNKNMIRVPKVVDK